jgi:tricorn protease-like protein
VIAVGAAVLLLSVAAVLIDGRRTRSGTLTIRRNRHDVRVTIAKGGREVRRPTGEMFVTLPPGTYDLGLDGSPAGLRVVPDRVTIEPAGATDVAVEPQPAPVPEPVHAANPTDVPAPKPEASAASTPEPKPEATAAPPPVPTAPEAVGVVRVYPHGTGGERVNAVAVTPDGRRILSAGNDGHVRVLETATAKEVGGFPHGRPVFAVAVMPDGKSAVSAGGDHRARLWELETGQEIATFQGHTRQVNAVAVAPGGGRLITGSDDGTARLWDVRSPKDPVVLKHEGPVFAVAFTPDGKYALSAGADKTLRVWDADSGADVATIDAGGAVFALAVSPDGSIALAGGENGRLAVIDLKAEGRGNTRLLPGGPIDWVGCLAFLPLPRDSRRVLAGYRGGKMVVWDVAKAEVLQTLPAADGGRLGLALEPDRLHAFTADDDGHVRLWRLPAPAGSRPGGVEE